MTIDQPLTANRYLEGVCGPVAEELTALDLPVVGTIPEELEGRWLRNGPNPIEDVDPATHHWFAGDGMVHGVRLRGGRAEWYRNRWVRSDTIAEALGEEPIGGPGFGGRTQHGPNTNVGGFAGRTWAMVEGGGTPCELTYELDTIARNDFDGTLPAAFSAHPKYDPSTGELHAMTYAWPDLVDHIQYVVVAPDGRVHKVVDIPVPDMPMVHDISITDRYAVVFDLAVTVDFDVMAKGIAVPFGWQDDRQCRVGLLPRDAVDASGIIWCDVDPCALFHPLNAYDDADGNVVIDFCRYESMFKHDHHGPFGDLAPTLDRWTINPTTRAVAEERVDDRCHEFPRHDPRVGLKQHRYGYTSEVRPGAPMLHGATFKTDYSTGTVTTHDHGQGRGGAEPIFIPKAGSVAEDDGWLITLVHDLNGGQAGGLGAELCILDANDLSEPPVATITLPAHVPVGFHGNWVPDSSVAP
ncbi:MAG: carotenoid oxygenase family protein [Actinomycetota bacterium]